MPTPVVIFLTTTGAGTFPLPSDWNPADHYVHTIGGGSGGTDNGYGGAGGEYAGGTVPAWLPGDVLSFSVGEGGLGAQQVGNTVGTINGLAGGDTWIGGASFATAAIAAHGAPLNDRTGPRALGGGQTAPGTGTVTKAGGPGGTLGSGNPSGAGGAGGPNGFGASGGVCDNVNLAGVGGGGADGGTAGGNGVGNTIGGNGGDNFFGSGGGLGSQSGLNGTGSDGTDGGGGGGGGRTGSPGRGGDGSLWISTLGAVAGPGGGAGSVGISNTTNQTTKRGGLYGGGGSASRASAVAGNGAQGIIVLIYTPAGGSDITGTLDATLAAGYIAEFTGIVQPVPPPVDQIDMHDGKPGEDHQADRDNAKKEAAEKLRKAVRKAYRKANGLAEEVEPETVEQPADLKELARAIQADIKTDGINARLREVQLMIAEYRAEMARQAAQRAEDAIAILLLLS